MNLTTARDIVRTFTRNGQDIVQYKTAAVDYAIIVMGNRLVRDARCTAQKSTLAITAGTYALSFTALNANFRPDWANSMRIADDGVDYTSSDVASNLRITDLASVQDKRHCSTASGVPQLIGFGSLADAELWPKPSKNGTLNIWWVPPFITFTAGTATPNSVTINLPDDIAYEAFRLGGPAQLQSNEKEHAAEAQRSGADFDAFVEKCKGKFTLGGRIVIREPTRRY